MDKFEINPSNNLFGIFILLAVLAIIQSNMEWVVCLVMFCLLGMIRIHVLNLNK
jgi:hypothetical protein